MLRKEVAVVVVAVAVAAVEGESVLNGCGGGGVCVYYGTCGFGTSRRH